MIITEDDWLVKQLENLDRKNIPITFHPHALDRLHCWKLDLDKAEEVIRTGRTLDSKCERSNKLCFTRYFGKENTTYIIITRIHKEFIEVKTAWSRKGR